MLVGCNSQNTESALANKHALHMHDLCMHMYMMYAYRIAGCI